MISLQFNAIQTQHCLTVGPAEGFRIAGNFLRQLPDNKVLGHYARRQWHVRDGHFSRYDCKEPCLVHFSDREGTSSETFGPVPQLYVADGTMYAGDALFAKFIDETLLWHSFELQTYWPNLIISAP